MEIYLKLVIFDLEKIDPDGDVCKLVSSPQSQNNSYLIYASVNNTEIVLDTLNQIYSFEPASFLSSEVLGSSMKPID